jgi:hypothetical protein
VFLGGVITQYVSWPWVFYINIPIAVVALLATPALMPAGAARGRGSVDVVGAVTVTAGLALLAVGLAWLSTAGVEASPGFLLGAQLVLGAGPLAVAPELSRGEPIAPYTRAGRALALQALGLALTRLALPEDRILLGALPPDALADPRELRHGLAEIAIRRLAFPDHPLAIEEPESAEAATGWSQALVAWLAPGPAPALVVCRPTRSFGSTQISGLRMATEAARWLGDGRHLGDLRGEPLEYASEALDVAVATLRGLGSDGWEPLLDGGSSRPRSDGASTSDRIGAGGVYP